ncbi:MAG: prepilin-type N-terminal cleavage/methylation domain-containing protein [Bdellovibrionales bacterium]|nr:prepilin-type N-terminal cleavage/methylation domain-containing protein [Bdellovibrionales bacterium]
MVRLVKNNRGFSLIELMVVVAIIAILASFAIPQYQTFQAKARQKEGLTLLGSYFTAAQATFAEIGIYPGNFVSTGFAPTGQVHYRITTVDNATPNPVGIPEMATCVNTSVQCDCGGACVPFWTWREAPAAGIFFPTAANQAVATTDVTFLIEASARIKQGGNEDHWTMDHLKQLLNPVQGLL